MIQDSLGQADRRWWSLAAVASGASNQPVCVTSSKRPRAQKESPSLQGPVPRARVEESCPPGLPTQLGWMDGRMDGWIFGLCGDPGLPLALLLVVCASAEVGCEAARLSEMPTRWMGHRKGGLTRETRYRKKRVVVACGCLSRRGGGASIHAGHGRLLLERPCHPCRRWVHFSRGRWCAPPGAWHPGRFAW